MARIESIRIRLENWALYKARESGGGMGWHSSSSFLKEAGGGGYREAQIPIFDEEAAVTDLAVEALQPERPLLYQTLQLHYLGPPDGPPMTVLGIAQHHRCQASTVNARLQAADRAIAIWLHERATSHKSVPSAN